VSGPISVSSEQVYYHSWLTSQLHCQHSHAYVIPRHAGCVSDCQLDHCLRMGLLCCEQDVALLQKACGRRCGKKVKLYVIGTNQAHQHESFDGQGISLELRCRRIIMLSLSVLESACYELHARPCKHSIKGGYCVSRLSRNNTILSCRKMSVE
jgi:hypothetical protein